MAVDTTPSQVATNALQALPFGSMIGGPLNACIEAQAMAAQTTWRFIQEVGLTTNEKGEKEAVTVEFQFLKDGHMVQLNVPLLTIVPIPYIAIHSIDINFKANISASSSSVSEQSESTEAGGSLDVAAKVGFGPFSATANMKANYSSKKDSKATQDSKYSVEYTMDIAVKAGQDSMPAGLAKVLEMLGNAMDVSDPKGTLEASSSRVALVDGTAQAILTYKNNKGLFAPDQIQCADAELVIDGDNVIATFSSEGSRTITAGDKSITITVK